jgi:hypothetical protein
MDEYVLAEQVKEMKSLDDVMKLNVIIDNLGKYTYLEICEMFEGKLPFDISKMK